LLIGFEWSICGTSACRIC